MHSAELVELAALVAIDAPALVRLTKNLPDAELERYWTASKCRQDRWQLALLAFKESRQQLIGATGGLHRFALGMFEEILTGEILARVWCGVLAACDARHGVDHAEPVARSVLVGHLEVRCRTLTLLSTSREIPLGGLSELNRLRRICERWTDLFLAELAHYADLSSLAHEQARMREFAADVPRDSGGGYSRMRHALLRSSLRSAFHRPEPLPAPNSDLNRQIAAGVLGCFQPELFDGAGVLRSAWAARLMVAADDAELMLADYLAPAGVNLRDKPGRRGLRRF
jgi:hypothetical protein